MKLISQSQTVALVAGSFILAAVSARAQSLQSFNAGDLVVSYVSDSVAAAPGSGSLDTASPISLQQFSLSSGGTVATDDGLPFVLPQTSSGNNSAISGEYGSASEGILEDSSNGAYLTIMGYGVNAATFNTAAAAGSSSPYGTAALGQTTSLTAANQTGSTTLTTVPRVVALIGANGSVDTSTALTGVFNTNNPRSVATVDGTSFYVSGQGASTGDTTGGLFYATDGATTATPINTTTSPLPTGSATVSASTGTETRTVEIVNTANGPTLWASRDYSPSGTPNDSTDIRSFTDSTTGGLPTSSNVNVSRVLQTTNSVNGGNLSSIDLTTALENGVNNSRVGKFVYLSPEQFYLAAPNVMYVADSGAPKNGTAVTGAGLGEGGLQKWVNSNANGTGTWTLTYDLVSGLNLVAANPSVAGSNPTQAGVTGLFGLTGEVVGGNVELFATSYGFGELSQSYLYEITDSLSATTLPTSESFTTLYTDPTGDTSLRGVAFAPVATPEPSTWVLLGAAFVGLAWFHRRRQQA